MSGVGYARAEAAGPSATRFHEIRFVVSNLGVFDFATPDHSMRLASVHPGVTVDEVVAATGFALVVPDEVPDTRDPDPGGARPPPLRARPAGPAGPRGPGMTHAALHTPFCDLVGVRYPIVQTGMGWVAGPRLVAATAEAGGLGILASATMTYEELVTAIGEVRVAHRPPLRRQHAHRRRRRR